MTLSPALIDAIARGRPTVVFDLDGCLVHSSPDIAAALNATVEPYGASFTLREVERMVGDGLSALFDKAIAARGLKFSPTEVKSGFDAFYARYEAAPSRHSEPRAWVAEVARALFDNGGRVSVCTNKVEPIALSIMDALGLSGCVHATVGHVAGRAKKPDPEPMRLAMKLSGGDPAKAVMVGDSAADLGAARGAGMPVVLVTGGYGMDDARSLPADFVADNADELLRAILAATGCLAPA